MPPPKTQLEKQQQTANMLSAGNLWYQRKSAQELGKLVEVNERGNEIAQKSLHVQQQQAAIQKLSLGVQQEANNMQRMEILKNDARELKKDQKEEEKESAERATKIIRDAFFNLKVEISDLEKSDISPLEKYFSLHSISAMIKEHDISTDKVSDFNDKEVVHNTLTNLDDLIKKNESELSGDDNSDIGTIIDIMSVDEEAEISNVDTQSSNKIKELKEKIDKLANPKEIVEFEKIDKIASLVEKYADIIENLK